MRQNNRLSGSAALCAASKTTLICETGRMIPPFTATYPFERDPLSYCFVRIDTDEGLVGYGEACDSYGCSYAGVLAAVVNDAYAPLLIGQEVMAVESLVERLRLHTRRRLGDQWIAPQARDGGGVCGG